MLWSVTGSAKDAYLLDCGLAWGNALHTPDWWAFICLQVLSAHEAAVFESECPPKAPMEEHDWQRGRALGPTR